MSLRQGRIAYHKMYRLLQEKIDILITLKLKHMHIKEQSNQQVKRSHRLRRDISKMYKTTIGLISRIHIELLQT